MTAPGVPEIVEAVRQAALEAHSAGCSLIPIRDDTTKRPDLPGWKAYQEHRATGQQVETWFAPSSGRIGLGIVAGRVSGGIECLALLWLLLLLWLLWTRFRHRCRLWVRQRLLVLLVLCCVCHSRLRIM